LAYGALLSQMEVRPAFAQKTKSPSDSTARITAKDINGGPNPCVITKPGQYALAEDRDWTARDANARGITIASDNVTLDLSGKILRQSNRPTPVINPNPSARPCRGEVVSGNVGIWTEGRKGIIIKNGTVLNVQGVGIVAKDCRDIDLLDLTVGYRIGRAVSRGLLENCRAVGNYSVGKNAPASGFMLNSASQIVLKHCVAIGNRNASGTDANNGFAAGFLASTMLPDPQGGTSRRACSHSTQRPRVLGGTQVLLAESVPNNGLQATPSSVRCAPAAGHAGVCALREWGQDCDRPPLRRPS
jgi:hypothetical protein